MKKGDKVKTYTSTKSGTITKIHRNGTVDVKYKGSKGVDNLPAVMCIKV